jgi:hypothetical protein
LNKNFFFPKAKKKENALSLENVSVINNLKVVCFSIEQGVHFNVTKVFKFSLVFLLVASENEKRDGTIFWQEHVKKTLCFFEAEHSQNT